MKRGRKVLIIIGIALIALIAAVFIYLNDYYKAGEDAQMCISHQADGVEVTENAKGVYAFIPENGEASAGVIFYPGGKVEAESYAPLMKALAERDILAVLVSMPANLAVLDVDAAEGIQGMYPEITDWYMAGHSLGGSMAASYLEKTDEHFEGLIMLAAYSTEDLTDNGISVLSVYGDQDGVLDMTKYREYKSNLPEGYSEYIIKGGCHAYFGDYGRQDGDGQPSVTADEQIRETGDIIQIFIFDYSV